MDEGIRIWLWDGYPQLFSVVDQEKNSLDNLKYKGFNGLSMVSTTEKMRKCWIGFYLITKNNNLG